MDSLAQRVLQYGLFGALMLLDSQSVYRELDSTETFSPVKYTGDPEGSCNKFCCAACYVRQLKTSLIICIAAISGSE